MRVVIVDSDVSYPPDSGKRLRTLNLMLPLADRHQITYLARVDGQHGQVAAAREFLQDHGIQAEFVADPLPSKAGLHFYARLAANLFSSQPYSVASHRSPRMRAAVNRLAARQPVDLWQCEWTGYLPALRDQPRHQRLLVAHNVDSLIWQRYFEVETGLARRRYVREQWRKFERFERSAFQQVRRIVAVSETDAQRIRDLFGVTAVDVVDNGIDYEWLAAARGPRKPGQYLFLGSLDWRPNQDAVRRLLDDVVPRINRQHPAARLLIVGRRPPPWIRQRVRELDRVELIADVPDVRPYLAESNAMIVPLRIGGGSRLKILEALATGLPVVSTSVGAEGLELAPGRHYLLADTDEELAAATLKCLTNPAAAGALVDEGRRLVQQQYDWRILAERVHDIWMSLEDSAVPCG